jgi:lipopolysaccharide transport system ATP-binding protein
MLLAMLSKHEIHERYRALSGVNLVVAKGESWGIVGENGAGKSTLLKIVAGVVKPSSGICTVSGRLTALLELGAGFHPDYTGQENIYLASSLMGWSRSETNKHLEQIVAFADIGEHIHQPVKTYSSGMVVRLGFAVATALKPEILVTDEVLAVGDESFQKKCIRWMDQFRSDGGTLVLCSHSMYQVQSLCDKAIWIHHGRAEMQGDVYAVTQAYLAYHERKTTAEHVREAKAAESGVHPRVESLVSISHQGEEQSSFAMGDTVVIEGKFYSPDDHPVVLGVGVARIDGTPVFGAFSNDSDFVPTRIAERLFAFRFVLPEIALLPGQYHVKAHTLDEFGLRLFDTYMITVTISGNTREHGFVKLNHRWESA